jgi:hypothetical protein
MNLVLVIIVVSIPRNVLKWRLQLKSMFENNSTKTSNNVNGADEKISKSKDEGENDEDEDYDENEKLEGEIKEALYNEKKIDKK